MRKLGQFSKITETACHVGLGVIEADKMFGSGPLRNLPPQTLECHSLFTCS